MAIDDKGDIFVLDQPVAIEDLAAQLQELAKDGFDERIYVRGAKTVNYGRIAEVMSIVTDRRLQEGGAGHRAGRRSERGLPLKAPFPNRASSFRLRVHVAALVATLVAFSDSQKFEDCRRRCRSRW